MPRGGAWGERVAGAARDRGLEPLIVPLITATGPEDPAPLHAAVRRLVDGQYAWLVVTSATAVRVIGGLVPGLQTGDGGIRVAAVGEATAGAARAHGWNVDVVPESASAADLARALPDTDGSVLFPRSDIAYPDLVDGLRARGIDVDDVVAYRTVGTGTATLQLDTAPDAVMVTSGSIAREVALRLPNRDGVRIACIGPRTATEARAAGLTVHVIGRSRSVESLLDAIVADLEQTPLDPHPSALPSVRPSAERHP